MAPTAVVQLVYYNHHIGRYVKYKVIKVQISHVIIYLLFYIKLY